MADCIGIGFPQFSCVLVQMRYSIGENGCGHILKGRTADGKTVKKRINGKKRGEGKRGWEYVEGNSRTGGKKYLKFETIQLLLLLLLLLLLFLLYILADLARTS